MINKVQIILLACTIALLLLSAAKLSTNQPNSSPVPHQAGNSPIEAVQQTVFQSSGQIDPAISASELLSSGQYVVSPLSSFILDEKFHIGSGISPPVGNHPTCEAYGEINLAGFVLKSTQVSILGATITVYYPSWQDQSETSQNYNNLVGYLGFPQDISGSNNGCSLFAASSPEIYSSFSAGSIDLKNTISCLPEPSTNTATNKNIESLYPNFINWSNSDIFEYGDTGYYYAVNNSFKPYQQENSNVQPTPSGTSLIIPSISCGSTYPNNYIPLNLLAVGPVTHIVSLSGFTPSVGLASYNNGFLFFYLIDKSLIPWQFAGAFASYGLFSMNFGLSYPTLNYAKFPNGNNADSQYLNVSENFSTPIYIGGKPFSVYYDSQIVLSYPGNPTSVTNLVEHDKNVSMYSIPNLENGYYPGLGAYPYTFASSAFAYSKTAAIFPLCHTSGSGNVASDCTFENVSSMNPISYERFWDFETDPIVGGFSSSFPFFAPPASYTNNLDTSPYSPGYDPSNPLNAVTQGALSSFCFYNESFSNGNVPNKPLGFYSSPSFTRVIPSLPEEGYYSAIGKCNGIFNSSNCFSTVGRTGVTPDGNFLNFQDGIFISKVSCTKNGIYPNSVTDAWINSIYLSNDAGQYCGLFGGKKNPVNPMANSTMFSQNYGIACPSFSASNGVAPLVISVKNVGNANITNPFMYVLFNDTNITHMFYGSNGKFDAYEAYNNYEDFLNAISGDVLQLQYNNSLNSNYEDVLVTQSGAPLNPVPIQQFMSVASNYGYGPFNDSLLGMWQYWNGKVIRSSNTFLSSSGYSNGYPPIIEPNQTAAFTVNIPMPVLKALLAGKFKVGVYFGDAFNVSWDVSGGGPGTSASPSSKPLLASGEANANLTHNDEFLTLHSNQPTPPWQYLVSYNLNLSQSPFSGTSIYNVSLNLSVSPSVSNVSILKLNINAPTSIQTGNQLQSSSNPPLGSSISCFASQDNLNDFSVLWDVQTASPANLTYVLNSSSLLAGNDVSKVLINRWRGILFMPYADDVVLNYNNVIATVRSVVSMQLQRPSINSTTATIDKNAFVYLTGGSAASAFSDMGTVYSFLNSSNVTISNPLNLPSSNNGFYLVANNLQGNRSILRIEVLKNLVSASEFASVPMTIRATGPNNCSINGVTAQSGLFNTTSSCITRDTVVNKSLINITAASGPFTVELYNSTISYPTAGNSITLGTGAVTLVSSNISTKYPGGYYAILNVSRSLANGAGLQFSFTPLTQFASNADIYLHYINGTPFNCNLINNIFGVSYKNSEIAPGEYHSFSGTLLCNVNSMFNYVRAVAINASSGAYIGSGDVGLGVAVQNGGLNKLYVTVDGAPLNSQSVTLLNTNSNETQCAVFQQAVNNGTIIFSKGCSLQNGGNYTLVFSSDVGSQIVPNSVLLPNISLGTVGNFILFSPNDVADNPTYMQNISVPATIANVTVPVSFSIPIDGVSCNNVRVVSDSPYPFAEIPYQTTSSGGGTCTYTFVSSPPFFPSTDSYTVFVGNTQDSISYQSDWLNASSIGTSFNINANNYYTSLMSSCRPGLGPCLGNVSLGKYTGLGDLLINNVSASSPSISQTLSGPVEDCFSVSYNAYSDSFAQYSGFGSINYNLNRLYQSYNPTQNAVSTFCFYKGADVITDNIYSTGNQVSFNLTDSLLPVFNYVKTNNGSTFYVPPQKFVGYSSYVQQYINQTGYGTSSQTSSNIYGQCIPNMPKNVSSIAPNSSTSKYTYVPIPSSSFDESAGPFYCVAATSPTYTLELSTSASGNALPFKDGSVIGAAYTPGSYNLSGQLLYDMCSLTQNISSNSKLKVLTEPQMYVNSALSNYNPNNADQRTIADNTILSSQVSALVSSNSNGGVLVSSCQIPGMNTSVGNYTVCTKPTPLVPSSSNVESLPSSAEGFGGRCLIDSSFPQCVPTYGTLSNSYAGSTCKSSSSCSATKSIPYQYSTGTRFPTPVSLDPYASFTCSGKVSLTESVSYPIINDTNGRQISSCNITASNTQSVSCNYGSSNSQCNASFNEGGFNTANPISPVSSCSISTSTSSYSTFDTANSCSSLPVNQSYGSPTETLQSVTPMYTSVSTTSLALPQSEPTFFNSTSFLCGNKTNIIASDVVSGWSWKSFSTSYTGGVPTQNGVSLPEVGGCEAGRDIYDIQSPTITNENVTTYYYQTYSCPSGYSGSILSCVNGLSSSQAYALGFNKIANTTFNYNSCASSYNLYRLSLDRQLINAAPKTCAAFSNQDFTKPNVSNDCIVYGLPVSQSAEFSYEIQYSNSSETQDIGIGLGLLSNSTTAGINLPSGQLATKIKDQYMSALSVSQKEFSTLFTELYPTSILGSATEATALYQSGIFQYDLLNNLMDQNPYFGVSGIPGFINGSAFDYALNIFSGGTSQNCALSSGESSHKIFRIGEGQLCSGSTLPAKYSSGIYLPLGLLNQGLHAIQFYSVDEIGNSSTPQVNVYDSVGKANSLNAACTNGNQRTFTSVYKGGNWNINITSDDQCLPINNELYGYVVNCMYQTPNNQTFSVASQYYLAYNLPTIWKITYSLLVSPRSNEIIPVPIYARNSRYLSIFPNGSS